MKIIEIESDILLFQFEPDQNKIVGNNIYAILDQDKALLIDTGFEEHMREVKSELSERKINIDTVIISHFHPDHFFGLKIIGPETKIGSWKYFETMERFLEKNDKPSVYSPDIKVKTSYWLNFGRHTMEIIENPGHSVCTLITQINSKYTHTGDELLFTNNGNPILPYIGLANNRRHTESLNNLLLIMNETVLPGHGPVLKNNKDLYQDISFRMEYMNNINKSNGRIGYKEAKPEEYEFLNSNWHEYNCR